MKVYEYSEKEKILFDFLEVNREGVSPMMAWQNLALTAFVCKDVVGTKFQQVINAIHRGWVYLDNGGYRNTEKFEELITVLYD